MECVQRVLATAASVLVRMLVILLGPLSIQLQYLLLVIGIDLVLGVWRARKSETFSSRYMVAKTIEKLIIYGAWIAIGNAADIITNWPVRAIILTVLLGEEVTSALSHTGDLGYSSLTTSLVNALTDLLKSALRSMVRGKLASPTNEEESDEEEEE